MYYPSDGFHGFKYSVGYVSALNAKSVLAKDKNARLQLATLALYLRELLEHYRRDRFMLGHFACAPDVYRRTIA